MDDYCRTHQDRLDSLHDDVKEIGQYIPKIEVALEKLLNVQDQLKGYASIHQDIFNTLRDNSRELALIKVEITSQGNRLSVLEDARKGMYKVVNPIISGVVLFVLAAILMLIVMHNITPKM